MLRIVIIGGECTGKTSLAEALAKQLNTNYLEEFSRSYAAERDRDLKYSDVMPIAHGQNISEQKFKSNQNLEIYDTCLLSTLVYSDIYYGKIPIELEDMLDLNRYDHFFLTCPLDQWVEDGIRKSILSPEGMHSRFQEELLQRKLSYTLLSGDFNKRFEKLLRTIESLGK